MMIPPVSMPAARLPPQPRPPVPREDDLPKIRNIYDELKPQSLGDPPPKPPRQGQGSPPQTKRKQPTSNGVAASGREGKAPPPAGNVSELDALLETLGSCVQQRADTVTGAFTQHAVCLGWHCMSGWVRGVVDSCVCWWSD